MKETESPFSRNTVLIYPDVIQRIPGDKKGFSLIVINYRAVKFYVTAQRLFQQLTALVLNAIGLTLKENLYSSGT